MNLYLLFFSIYGLLILPLRLHFRIRLGEKNSYLIQLEAIGFPLPGLRKAKRKGKHDREPAGLHALSELNMQLIRTLLEKKIFRKLLRMGRFDRLDLYATVSFPDAAATALSLTAAKIILRTLKKTGVLPAVFSADIRPDFQHTTPDLLLEGIVSVRMGKLVTTFLALGRSYLRRRRRTTDSLSPAV